MFGPRDGTISKQDLLLAVIALLLLSVAGGLIAYLLTIDRYLHDMAKSEGELQARIQAVEEQQRRDSADIDDLYNQMDQLNGYGPTDNSGQPQGSKI